MCSNFKGLDCASATAKSSGIGAASDVCGFCTRTQLIYQISILAQLRQLEVTSQDVTVASLKLVTQILHSVGVDQCASCFAFCVNGIGDCAGVLCAFVANSVNVAIGCANLLSQELFIPYFLQFPISSDYIFILLTRSSALLLGLLVSFLTHQSLNLRDYLLGIHLAWLLIGIFTYMSFVFFTSF